MTRTHIETARPSLSDPGLAAPAALVAPVVTVDTAQAGATDDPGPAANAVHTVTESLGLVGDYDLEFGEDVSSHVPGETAAQFKARLVAAGVGEDEDLDVSRTGNGSTTPHVYEIEFTGALGEQVIDAPTVDDATSLRTGIRLSKPRRTGRLSMTFKNSGDAPGTITFLEGDGPAANGRDLVLSVDDGDEIAIPQLDGSKYMHRGDFMIDLTGKFDFRAYSIGR